MIVVFHVKYRRSLRQIMTSTENLLCKTVIAIYKDKSDDNDCNDNKKHNDITTVNGG